jgi:hypothetical protein
MSFYCDICDKYYKSYHSLYNHKRDYHKKQKETKIVILYFNCKYCNKKFDRKYNMNRHQKTCKYSEIGIYDYNNKSINNNKSAYETCKFCDKKYLHIDLHIDICIDNPENQHECVYCQKFKGTYNNLKLHLEKCQNIKYLRNKKKISNMEKDGLFYLYIICNKDNPLTCKFGYTVSPLQRIRSLSHGYKSEGEFISLYKLQKEDTYIDIKLYKEPDNVIIKYRTLKNKLNNNKLYRELIYAKEAYNYLYKGTGGTEIFNIAGITSIKKAIENDLPKLGLKVIHNFDTYELYIINKKIYNFPEYNMSKKIQELITIYTGTNITEETNKEGIKEGIKEDFNNESETTKNKEKINRKKYKLET